METSQPINQQLQTLLEKLPADKVKELLAFGNFLLSRIQAQPKQQQNLGDRFAGVWQDERTAEEIVADIRNSRVNTDECEPEDKQRNERELLEENLELAREQNAQRKLVGYCGVDTGQLIITDPAYLPDFKSNLPFDDEGGDETVNGFEYSFAGCCAATTSKARAGQLVGWGWKKLSTEEAQLVKEGKLHAAGAFDSAGVAVHTGFGDGRYPVFVEYEGGFVKTVTVQFFE